ncbi:MAG: class I SAM-dependent methyltransferase, partial [Gammaproteobacteria bacterium]
MKISEGMLEDGIVVGNTYDKYGSRNPVVRWIMKGFADALTGLVAKAAPSTIHELGCGEGYWVLDWNQQGIEARGSDFSEKVIGFARENAECRGISPALFSARSIYDIEPGRDSADLVVCCEVLEHLEDPEAGLEALQRVATEYVILSVPREPIWCMLNMLRGKYVASFGNTPGHIQHWSS